MVARDCGISIDLLPSCVSSTAIPFSHVYVLPPSNTSTQIVGPGAENRKPAPADSRQTWYAPHAERVSSVSAESPPPGNVEGPIEGHDGGSAVERGGSGAAPPVQLTDLRWSEAGSVTSQRRMDSEESRHAKHSHTGAAGDLDAEWFSLFFKGLSADGRPPAEVDGEDETAYVPSPRLAALQSEVRRLTAAARQERRGVGAGVERTKMGTAAHRDEDEARAKRAVQAPVAEQHRLQEDTALHDTAASPNDMRKGDGRRPGREDERSDEGTASFLERVVGHRQVAPGRLYPPLMAHQRRTTSDSASTSTQHVLTALDVLQQEGRMHRGHVLPAHDRLAAMRLASRVGGSLERGPGSEGDHFDADVEERRRTYRSTYGGTTGDGANVEAGRRDDDDSDSDNGDLRAAKVRCGVFIVGGVLAVAAV